MSTPENKCENIIHYFHAKLTTHPNQANQNWGQHCLEALWFSGQSFAAGGAFLVHALVPCWFQEWGGDRIIALNNTIQTKRGSKKKSE